MEENLYFGTWQDKEFWDFVEQDFVCLSETWVEKKGWNNINGWLPRSHTWEYVFARRDKKKKRVERGFIIGKKKGWSDDNCELIVEKDKGVVVSLIREKKGEREKMYVIVSVYNEGNNWGINQLIIEEVIKRMVEAYKENHVIIEDNGSKMLK